MHPSHYTVKIDDLLDFLGQDHIHLHTLENQVHMLLFTF